MAKRATTKERKTRLTKAPPLADRQQLGGFRKRRGLDAEHCEPLLSESHPEIPDLLEMDSVRRELVRLMRRVRIRPELIYAYLRTGLIVTEENYQYLTAEDRYDWDRAMMEYARHVERP